MNFLKRLQNHTEHKMPTLLYSFQLYQAINIFSTRSDQSQGRVLHPVFDKEQQFACVYGYMHAWSANRWQKIDQTATFRHCLVYK